MLETNHPTKPFDGVCFVLRGFDLLDEQEIRSKLVERGGIDAGQYSENCTHVIVDKTVYDDPLCVKARKDCKMLVTGSWVDHSFDIGMPVDSSSIIYRPLKDLNGIPGAKVLVMCLTGYQRQDRDDIMTMVSLMGAQFSKPLVANKVTHLICYKFEGEKYELAKKLPKIKLVNHRWLDDCLRDWEILPEDGYNRSGHEMEMMEAEAKDSEEEVEDTSVRHTEENMHKTPNLKAGYPEACKSPKLVAERSNILPELALSKDSYVNSPKGKVRGPNIENKSDQALSFNDVPFSKAFDYQDVSGLKETTYNEMPHPHYRMPISKKASDDLTSSSGSAERPPHSEGKFSAVSYQRKTPRRLGELSRNGFAFDRQSMNKLKSDDLSASLSTTESSKDTIGLDCAEALQKGIDLQFGEKPTDFLPRKRALAGSFACPNLQKNNDAKPCIRKSPSPGDKSLGGQSTTFYDGFPETNISQAAFDSGCPLNDCADMNSALDSRLTDVITWSSSSTKSSLGGLRELGQEDNGNEKTSLSPSKRLKMPSLSTVPELKDLDVQNLKHVASDMREPQNHQQDVKGSAASNRDPETNSSGPSSPILVRNDNSVTKTLKKKMAAKKTLGSRPKLGSNANKKGSIYLDKKNAPQNNIVTCSSGDDNEKLAHAMTPEPCFTFVNNEGSRQMETEAASKPEDNAVHRTGSLDDETETPEEKIEQVLEDVTRTNKENAGPIELIGKADILSEKKSTGVQHSFNNTSASNHAVAPKEAKGGNASENAVDGNTSSMAEPSSKGDGLKKKREKGKTGAIDKSKKKKADDAEVMKSKEHVEETNDTNGVKDMETEKGVVTCPVAQSKNHNVSKKKLKKSVEEEKENEPIDCGAKNRSDAKRIAEKQAVSPSIEQSSAKSSPKSSRQVEGVANKARTEPAWFILSGHRLQRKEFQKVIRRLKGRFCRDSHQWSYQATHFIAPDPIRRTEKFFAAAASGRWILKTDYLAASNAAGKFAEEKPYEWYKNGLSEDGAINLEAPRKWRLLRERTDHGAFHGMRIIIYGECIAPPLDTLKRVVKAGDGTILATSPPYARFLNSSIDFAIVTPGMPRADAWVQEFLKHEIPCVVADYLVEYVCKPGYSLEKHVLYNSHAWAEKSFARLQTRAEELVVDLSPPDDYDADDVPCKVCGCRDRGEAMLICGDESGSTGCGVGCHMDCCDPPFEDIPQGEWFCSDCSDKRSKSGYKSAKNRKKRVSSVKLR